MKTSAIAIAGLALPLLANSVPAYSASDRQPDKEAAVYVERIKALDDTGPELNAVIAFDPDAAAKAKAVMGGNTLLDGRTVLVKDNIETREWPTTAGSLALKDNATGRDAPMIANLRAAGGIVLGKANLSEWANIRDDNSSSGWSAVGGLTRNPHAIDRNTCGSSSGSGMVSVVAASAAIKVHASYVTSWVGSGTVWKWS